MLLLIRGYEARVYNKIVKLLLKNVKASIWTDPVVTAIIGSEVILYTDK